MSDGEDKKTTTGTVEEVLPDSLFRVRLPAEALPRPSVAFGEGGAESGAEEGQPEKGHGEEGPLVLAYLAGKMRLHRIRVLVGDQVEMVLDPYGGRARIVRRLT
ncbi:MAG: hypothetical protein Q7S95_00890 [bacterium]|nr:hypothetical protein [bacterium]